MASDKPSLNYHWVMAAHEPNMLQSLFHYLFMHLLKFNYKDNQNENKELIYLQK